MCGCQFDVVEVCCRQYVFWSACWEWLYCKCDVAAQMEALTPTVNQHTLKVHTANAENFLLLISLMTPRSLLPSTGLKSLPPLPPPPNTQPCRSWPCGGFPYGLGEHQHRKSRKFRNPFVDGTRASAVLEAPNETTASRQQHRYVTYSSKRVGAKRAVIEAARMGIRAPHDNLCTSGLSQDRRLVYHPPFFSGYPGAKLCE